MGVNDLTTVMMAPRIYGSVPQFGCGLRPDSKHGGDLNPQTGALMEIWRKQADKYYFRNFVAQNTRKKMQPCKKELDL